MDDDDYRRVERIVIPAKVASVIARQREALANKVRITIAKAQAEQRMKDGIALFGGKPYRKQTKKSRIA
jgi:hypothetical protein